jgi:hypothetical protein
MDLLELEILPEVPAYMDETAPILRCPSCHWMWALRSNPPTAAAEDSLVKTRAQVLEERYDREIDEMIAAKLKKCTWRRRSRPPRASSCARSSRSTPSLRTRSPSASGTT